MTAYIHRLPTSAAPWDYAVEFDYSAEMVDAIKAKIPSRQRAWKPDVKQWWFRAEVIDAVCLLAVLHCGGYQHVEAPVAHRTPVDAYAALHLLPTAPPEVVSAAYKALAKKSHPDAGGDKEAMQRLNAAYKLLQHVV